MYRKTLRRTATICVLLSGIVMHTSMARCQGLMSGLTGGLPPAPRAGTTTPALPQTGRLVGLPQQLRLVPFELQDPMVQATALKMLVVQGWNVTGGIVWRPNNAGLAVVDMTVSSPDNKHKLRAYPTDYFCYAEYLTMTFPIGTNYMGMELQQPMLDVKQYLRSVVLPRYRGNSTIQLGAAQPLPQIAASIAQTMQEPGVQKRAIAARVRGTYTAVDGTPMEEDFYCVLWMCHSAMSPRFVQWGCERCYSFAAPRGQLDQSAKQFQVMVASVQTQPAWLHKYEQVRQLFLERLASGIRNAGQLSQYLAQINNDIDETIIRGYEQRQRQLDRVNREFSNYIRGVQDYQRPGGAMVSLPAGYQTAWVNNMGQYLLSNQPGFDPNNQLTGNWQPLTSSPNG